MERHDVDRVGRRRMLAAGAVLVIFAEGLFAVTHSFWLRLVAANVGVLSPSGKEVGAAMVLPFLGLSPSVEPPRAMRVSERARTLTGRARREAHRHGSIVFNCLAATRPMP